MLKWMIVLYYGEFGEKIPKIEIIDKENAMLVQYSVKNFASIREEITISFECEKNLKDKLWVMERDDMGAIYNAIALVGPNASGKTTILNSLMFSFQFIYENIQRNPNSKTNREYFGFDESGREMPTEFEYIFIKNNIQYVYGFSVDDNRVIDEYLMAYYTKKPTTLFDRSNTSVYSFKGNDVGTQNKIKDMVADNRLYMPIAASMEYKKLKDVFDWFENACNFMRTSKYECLDKVLSNRIQKEKMIEELKNADFNIKDIYIKKEKLSSDASSFGDRLFKFLAEEVGEKQKIVVPKEILHSYIVHENDTGEELTVEIDEESSGTKEYIFCLMQVLYAEMTGGMIFDDEVGRSFHSRLTEQYLKVLKSDRVKSNNVQMLFTSHDTKVLNHLNPGQVYLVDKDDQGATYVKPLSDYSIHAKDNIELGYLKGRFGGVPFMKG